MLIQAIEINATNSNQGLGFKFNMTSDNILSFNIKNNSEQDRQFTSNVIGMLDLKFMGFPCGAALQYKYPKRDGARTETTTEWYYASRHSSMAYDPELVRESRRMRDFKLPSRQVLSFPLEYARAIDVTTVFIPNDQLVFEEFRIKITIMVKLDGNQVSKEIVSDWLPCKALISKIQKERS